MAITQYSEITTAVENWLATTAYSGRSAEFIAMAEDRIADEVRCRAMESHVDLVVRGATAITAANLAGTANAITATSGLSLTALLIGHRFGFTAEATNTGATTFNVDSLGATNVRKYIGGIISDLEANDIVNGLAYEIVYDGTRYLLCPRGGYPLPSRYISSRRLLLEGQDEPALDFLPSVDFWREYASNTSGPPKAFTVEGDYIVWGPPSDGLYAGKFLYYRRFVAMSANADTNWLVQNRRAVYVYGALLEAAPFLGNDPRILTWSTLYDDAVEKVNLTAERGSYGGGPLVIRHGLAD